MKRNLNQYIGALLIALFSQMLYAQSARDHVLLNKLEHHFLKMDSLVLLPDSKQIRTLRWKCTLPTESAVDSALSSRSLAQMKEYVAATGLKWTGQAYYRTDKELGLDDEEQTVSHYRAKVQAEVRWDFLHSGLFQRKSEAKSLALKETIDRKKYSKEQYETWSEVQKESLAAYYDAFLAGVLSYRINNFGLLSEIRTYMLEHELTGSELLLNMLGEQAEAERRMEQLRPTSIAALNEASAEGTLFCVPPSFSQVKIDTLQLYEQVRRSDLDVAILQLRMQLLDQQTKRSTYLASSNLSPFVRYSQYLINRSDNSRNVDVGLTFTLPLSNESKRKRQTLRSERRVLECELAEVRRNVEQQVRRLVSSIDRLDRMIEGETRRMNEAKAYIAMRSNAYHRQYGDYNALARIKEYDNYFSYWEKLLNDYYQRDCLLIDLQEFLVDIPVGSLSK